MAGCPPKAAAASLAAFLVAILATISFCLGVTLGPSMIFTATLEVNRDLLGSRSASLLLSYKDSLQGGCDVGLNQLEGGCWYH